MHSDPAGPPGPDQPAAGAWASPSGARTGEPVDQARAGDRYDDFAEVPDHPEQADAVVQSRMLERALYEIKKVIVGQDRAIERLFVCLLSGGHVLLEGVPGLAKTLAVETLADVVGGRFTRLQFTPDMLPADIVGTRIYRGSTEQFDIELGPVFVNFVLADEINRAPAKVQSALLEVMAEHQVSIGGQTFAVPEPFLVLATPTPIESEGVYPLPEAQRDRFMMKVVIGYPSPTEELEIVHRMGVRPPVAEEVLTLDDLRRAQQATEQIYVDHGVIDYAVNLVLATRTPERFNLPELSDLLSFGASPRASLALVSGARALALLRGRTYAVPQDVFDIAPDVLRHRIVLSYEALAQGLSPDQILARLLSTVPAPRLSPGQGAAVPGTAPMPGTGAPPTTERGHTPAPAPTGWMRPNA
jgi:MoxR-like ATPase